ncbi:GLPGLI family protein [Flavobacterium macrobrachii]|uniref:GLPGLI family protein n=1 Tax=Flavobacterium macrobrachii TaxID=591204 RepID=A0ABS2D0D0_9FLAO|nr:GLPGLI family protein [Flavobacterium macrobrachii]MBM6500674.1 GLPGLI family protein [Flavobacterium macrobrachii]
MKFKILTFILLVNVAYLSGQKSGNVTYIIKPIAFEVKEDAKQKEIVNEIIKNAEKQKFILEFNSHQSAFYYMEDLSNQELKEDLIYQLAAKRFTSDFHYYLNSNENKEFFLKNDGYTIENTYLKKDWKITTETKTIDNYLCYKAIYEYDYLARDKKIKTRIITAWFAPNLPFSYGPKNYNGLPGLILELQDWDTTFLATKIELFDKEIKIDFPKGKTITQEEYERKVLSGN